MHKRSIGHLLLVAICVIGLSMSVSIGVAVADTATSSHYMVTETQFGSGSSLQSCSGSYCSKQGVGDTVVGDTSSANYRAKGGFNSGSEPYLEVSTEGGTQNLGVLDIDKTATASAVIKIRNYMSTGYVMQITGASPSQGTHMLRAMTTPSTSHQGAEQFGINMAANTEPAIGAAPVQVPASEFSFGAAADDYAASNLFKYVEGDIVAQSTKSSGETDYTLSMILNVSNITPGGKYTGELSAVVVPVY